MLGCFSSTNNDKVVRYGVYIQLVVALAAVSHSWIVKPSPHSAGLEIQVLSFEGNFPPRVSSQCRSFKSTLSNRHSYSPESPRRFQTPRNRCRGGGEPVSQVPNGNLEQVITGRLTF